MLILKVIFFVSGIVACFAVGMVWATERSIWPDLPLPNRIQLSVSGMLGCSLLWLGAGFPASLAVGLPFIFAGYVLGGNAIGLFTLIVKGREIPPLWRIKPKHQVAPNHEDWRSFLS